MKIERNGVYLDTFMSHTTLLSQRSGAPSAISNTYLTTTSKLANSASKVRIVTSHPSPSLAWSYLASPAKIQAVRQVKQDNPLSKYPKWRDAEYRRAYLLASIEQGIAWQIKTNRNARGLSQTDLANALGTKQSAVSRLEDPSYGGYTLDTLVSVAQAFDCAVSLRFVPYSALARESQDLSPEALYAAPYPEEISTSKA